MAGRLSLAVLLMAGAGLSACTADTPPESGAENDPSLASCGLDGYTWLVGQSLAAVTLPADLNARVIGPDTVVTQDYRPDRGNIHVDADSVVHRLSCG